MGKYKNKTRKYKKYDKNIKNNLRGGQQAQTASGVLSNTIVDAIQATGRFFLSKTARLAGYVPIDEKNMPPPPPGPIEDLVSDLVYELNEQLEIQKRNGNLDKATKETVQILGEVLQNINTEINKPEFVESIKNASVNIGKLSEDIVEATTPSINNIIDDLSASLVRMVSRILRSIIKIIVNTLAAVPGAGAVIGGVNDVTAIIEMITSLIEAAANTIYIFSHGFNTAVIDIEQVLLKRKAANSRSSKNIDNFSNTDNFKPTEPSQPPKNMNGGYRKKRHKKTRRK